jgi:hypothetical protein
MGVLNKPVPSMTSFANFQMTMPAFLVIMMATILFVLTSLMAIFAGKPAILVVTVLAYAVAVYTTYVVNCLTVGSCNLLAWVLGVVYVIVVGLIILGYIMSVFKKGVRATVGDYKPPFM